MFVCLHRDGLPVVDMRVVDPAGFKAMIITIWDSDTLGDDFIGALKLRPGMFFGAFLFPSHPCHQFKSYEISLLCAVGCDMLNSNLNDDRWHSAGPARSLAALGAGPQSPTRGCAYLPKQQNALLSACRHASILPRQAAGSSHHSIAVRNIGKTIRFLVAMGAYCA